MSVWKLVFSAGLLAGVASAAEPVNTQDPPGNNRVDQPAGVSASERNTERDTTDTLRGGGRSDVIVGKRAAKRPAGPQIRPGQARASVQEGTETRSSLGGAGSGAGTASRPTPDQGDDAGTPSDSTSLGTDIGYGTGTEPAGVR